MSPFRRLWSISGGGSSETIDGYVKSNVNALQESSKREHEAEGEGLGRATSVMSCSLGAVAWLVVGFIRES